MPIRWSRRMKLNIAKNSLEKVHDWNNRILSDMEVLIGIIPLHIVIEPIYYYQKIQLCKDGSCRFCNEQEWSNCTRKKEMFGKSLSFRGITIITRPCGSIDVY